MKKVKCFPQPRLMTPRINYFSAINYKCYDRIVGDNISCLVVPNIYSLPLKIIGSRWEWIKIRFSSHWHQVQVLPGDQSKPKYCFLKVNISIHSHRLTQTHAHIYALSIYLSLCLSVCLSLSLYIYINEMFSCWSMGWVPAGQGFFFFSIISYTSVRWLKNWYLN